MQFPVQAKVGGPIKYVVVVRCKAVSKVFGNIPIMPYIACSFKYSAVIRADSSSLPCVTVFLIT